MSEPLRTADGHLACPFCEGRGLIERRTGTVNQHGAPEFVEEECEDCQGSGQKVTWGARAQLKGGHYLVSLWAGRKGMRANLGSVLMDADDWAEFQLQGERLSPPLDVTIWPQGGEL